MISLKLSLELNSNKLTLISSRKLLNHSSSLLKVLTWKRLKLTKSFWSVDQQEFLKLDNLSKNSSTVNSPTLVLILMRLSAMVLLSKVVSFAVKILKMEKESSLLMLHLFHWALKLLVELWAKLFQKDHTSQLRNLKFSLLIKIINKQSLFKFSKVKDH